MAPNDSTDAVYYNSVYRNVVDEKRRVQIPAKWRPENGDQRFTLMVWKKSTQQDACLLVLPPQLMQTLTQKLTAMPFADPRVEALRRLLGSNSDQVPLDSVGRICLPEGMAKAAGIKTQAVLVGMFDRFQIWSPERHTGVSVLDEALSTEAFGLI